VTDYFDAEQVPAPQLACAFEPFFAGAAGALGFAGAAGVAATGAAGAAGVATVAVVGVAVPVAEAATPSAGALGTAGTATAAGKAGAAGAAGGVTSTDWTGVCATGSAPPHPTMTVAPSAASVVAMCSRDRLGRILVSLLSFEAF
jgi:hypothetical protein